MFLQLKGVSVTVQAAAQHKRRGAQYCPMVQRQLRQCPLRMEHDGSVTCSFTATSLQLTVASPAQTGVCCMLTCQLSRKQW